MSRPVKLLREELEQKKAELTKAKVTVTTVEAEILELNHAIVILSTGNDGRSQISQIDKPKRGPPSTKEIVASIQHKGMKRNIYKHVLTDIMDGIADIPKGEWFSQKYVRECVPNKDKETTLLYLKYLIESKVLEHNGRKRGGSKYRKHPEMKYSEAQLKRMVEEQRKLMNEG